MLNSFSDNDALKTEAFLAGFSLAKLEEGNAHQ